MKNLTPFCFLWLLLLATVAAADALVVGYQKTVTLEVPQATAAFALDNSCVEASGKDGVVTLQGRSPGSTKIVVITPRGTQTLEITVAEPAPQYPPGFEKPLPASAESQNGSYELRYSSEPAQIFSVVDLFKASGARQVRLHLANQNFLPGSLPQTAGSGRSWVNFPSGFLQFTNSTREITLLDQQTANSPLTVNGTTIRGFHLRQGPWVVHAGVTSVAVFQGLFLPANPEGVIGAGFRRDLSSRSSLTSNLYYFANQRGMAGRKGVVGSLVYEYKPAPRTRLLAEVGVSNGIGGSFLFEHERPGESIRARVHFQPAQFASLAVSNLHGFFSDFSWNRKFNARWSMDSSWSSARYRLPGFQHNTTVGRWTADYRFSEEWSIFGGAGYGSFSSPDAARPVVRDINLPFGLSYHTNHFGGTVQYQYGRSGTLGGPSTQVRTSAYAGGRNLRVSGYVDRQTQVPGLSYIFNESSGLAQTLQRLGLEATTPQQIAGLLGQNATLAALGYIKDVTVNLSLERLQAGGNVSWTSRGRRQAQFSLDGLYDRNQSVRNTVQSALATASYSMKLGPLTHFSVSYSLFRSRLPGRPSQFHPLFTVSLRRQIFSVPNFLLPEKQGAISGIVFRDDSAQGHMGSDKTGLAGVELILDGVRRTQTDRQGLYSFPRVASGRHVVEVLAHTRSNIYYTTPSQVETEMNTTVHFGVAYVRSRLTGFVKDDAGGGLPGVMVVATRGGQAQLAQTDTDGKFTFASLDAGEFTVELRSDALPAGYSPEVRSAQVSLAPDSPGRTEFIIKAFRNISGRVLRYDRSSGQYTGIAGLTVTLRELPLSSVTDASGGYLFRNLPAGQLTVVVKHGNREYVREVSLPAAPTFVKDADIRVMDLEVVSQSR